MLFRSFQSVLDLQNFGRNGVRPLDMLTGYRNCLYAGSVRLRTFDTLFNRALKNKRLPQEAAQVMEEIIPQFMDLLGSFFR